MEKYIMLRELICKPFQIAELADTERPKTQASHRVGMRIITFRGSLLTSVARRRRRYTVERQRQEQQRSTMNSAEQREYVSMVPEHAT